jgi:superfamily I DNA/RNA helicase
MRILARTREQVKDISNLLQWLGIPFASQLSYVADWDDELLHLYHALEKVSAYVTDGEDRALSLDEIRVLYSESDAVDEAAERTVDYMRRSGVSEADASTVVENAQARDGFLDGIGTKQPTANSQFNLGAETEKMLDNALLSGTQIDQTEVTINVQTIHSAKGLESPSVILYDAIPAPPDDMVEVANLYYVALTRASETCMVFTDAWGQQYDGMVPRGSTYTTGPSAVQRLIINQGGGA